MIRHVWERAGRSAAAEVVIATDDVRIAETATGFGARTVMTGRQHRSGTERAAEVAALLGWADDQIVVNCQGDVPLIPPASIDQVAALLAAPGAVIATLCTPITQATDYHSPHVVKVVRNADGDALYFSRSAIPAAGHGTLAGGQFPPSWRHIGLYAYRVGALRRLASADACQLEISESLEQLRALWLGLTIRVGDAQAAHGPDVDTPEDLVRAAAYLQREDASHAL